MGGRKDGGSCQGSQGALTPASRHCTHMNTCTLLPSSVCKAPILDPKVLEAGPVFSCLGPSDKPQTRKSAPQSPWDPSVQAIPFPKGHPPSPILSHLPPFRAFSPTALCPCTPRTLSHCEPSPLALSHATETVSSPQSTLTIHTHTHTDISHFTLILMAAHTLTGPSTAHTSSPSLLHSWTLTLGPVT